MILHRILLDGICLSVVATAVVLASLAENPRLWLQDYPPDIQAAVKPRNMAERRRARLWGIPFIGTLLGVPIFSAWRLASADPSASFGMLWLDAFGVAMVFNLVDLLLIDGLLICMLTPRFVIIPGTEGHAAYRDFGHHAKAFLFGTFGSCLVAVLAAFAAVMLPRWP
jgi:hypothetical protein